MKQIWDVVGLVTSTVHVIDVADANGIVIPFKVSCRCPRKETKHNSLLLNYRFICFVV